MVEIRRSLTQLTQLFDAINWVTIKTYKIIEPDTIVFENFGNWVNSKIIYTIYIVWSELEKGKRLLIGEILGGLKSLLVEIIFFSIMSFIKQLTKKLTFK